MSHWRGRRQRVAGDRYGATLRRRREFDTASDGGSGLGVRRGSRGLLRVRLGPRPVRAVGLGALPRLRRENRLRMSELSG